MLPLKSVCISTKERVGENALLSPASGSSLGRNDTRFVSGHKPNIKRCWRTFLPRRCQHDDPLRSMAPALQSRPSGLIKGHLFVLSSHLRCQRNGEHHEQPAINSRAPEDMAHIFISMEAHLRKPVPARSTLSPLKLRGAVRKAHKRG